MWGEPLSQKRLASCDNKITGVPAEFSRMGNIVCKISPYVGTVYQRYIFGPKREGNRPSVGCEAVLYAWGWTEPQDARSGQDYQAWFRNGELRFTRWYELSRKASISNPPAPDNHEWWNHMCQGAWTGEGNWLYTGTFRAGQTVYHDQASLPELTVAEVTQKGGILRLETIGATYNFPTGIFSDTVRVVEYVPDQRELPPSGGKTKIGLGFRIFAENKVSMQIVQPSAPYRVSIQYKPAQIGGATPSSLALYFWDGYGWIREKTSIVDVKTNTITAAPAHFSLWAVFGENSRLYRPHLPSRRR